MGRAGIGEPPATPTRAHACSQILQRPIPAVELTVEAVEGISTEQWLVAVQWHPEVLWQSEAEGAPHRAIFRAFVEAAGGS